MGLEQEINSALRLLRYASNGYLLSTNLEGDIILKPANITPPEAIPFDWDIDPVTSIDMTIEGREDFGNNPHVEIWLIDIDEEGTGNEYLYLPAYGVVKQKTAGVLTSIEFPDLDLEFSDYKKGYFLIYV